MITADLGQIRRHSLRNPLWSYLLWGLLLVIFAAETLTHLGFAHGALYPPLIVLAVLSQSERTVVSLATAAVFFTCLGLLISPPAPAGFSIIYVLLNRLFAIVGITISTWLAVVGLRYLDRLRELNRHLDNARDELERSTRLLRIACDVSLVGGWSLDVARDKLSWSGASAVIHGLGGDEDYSPAEVLRLFRPADQDILRRHIRTCITEGKPFEGEFQVVRDNGHQPWLRISGEPVHEGARVIRVQGALQDITSWRHTEQSLATSEQRFRQMTDAMPMIVWMADVDGTVIFYNQVFYDYTGFPCNQPPLAPQYAEILIHPEDRERIWRSWADTLTHGGHHYAIEVRLRHRDGGYRWHLSRAELSLDEGGQPLRWYGSMVDIDDERRRSQAFEQLAQRLNTTLESITDGFLMVDTAWRFTFVNQQGERILQKTRDQLLGTLMWDAFPEVAGSEFERQYQRAVQDRVSVKFEAYYPPLDLWADVHAYPSDEGLAIYFQDVSQRHKLEEQLRQSQRLEAVGQLTGGMAHDFNNLLTVIIGNGEVLREALAPDSTLKPLVDMVVTAAERGAALTHSLLAFARRQPLEPQQVDVNRLVSGLDGLLRRTLGADIDIEWVRAPGLWPALVDPAQLESALLNLALNARDAMPGGGSLTIETANIRISDDYARQHQELKPGQYVQVAVSDTGQGIPRDQLARVFEPFYTTKDLGKGTGLGLSMVFGFVKQSGGQINIYSEPGEGTTVKLYLPRATDTASSLVEPQTPAAKGNRQGATILLVEDDDLVRQFAATQLRAEGYTVLEAASGPAALALMESRPGVDLLFTDVVMPGGMSGRDLAEQLAASRPELKVLYTSGYTENAIVHHGRLDQGTCLLGKPYRRAELLTKVRELLDG